MKKVIIGHRGVGKTAFLKRHENYFKKMGLNIPHFDLDQQIELFTRESIIDIFKNKGQAHFRNLEEEVFKKITAENPSYVISVGAGFNLARISSDQDVLLLSRITDKAGRIFLNRPRLNPDESPLEEYQRRYLERHETYLDKATFLYSMPEGIDSENETEQKIVTGQFHIEDAFYTLTEKEIESIENVRNKYRVIELRTDLIPLHKINQLVQMYSQHQWLISVRKDEHILEFKNVRYDFDISLPHQPDFFHKNKHNIISCHTDDIDLALAQVQNIYGLHIKLSPTVETFTDLKKGYQWQQADPKNRSFLPRSKNGKWMWYRQLCKYLQEINFIRNFTFMKDQPSKYQWLSLPKKKPENFAAVLGQPVLFSRSPLQHQEFFAKLNSFFTAIEISEAELPENLKWLQSLGLAFAAITSPLKKVAFKIATEATELANQFESANTLYLKKETIAAHNTDVHGFRYLTKDVLSPNDKVAVWGGGGTLNMMRSVMPEAKYFSSTTGQLRDGSSAADFFPSVVVWAAPRTNETKWPPSTWKPKLVVDLNYVDNSMGLEYAQKMSLNYLSGLAMFKQQALEQQRFWSAAIQKR